jgi:hypothetical protein
MGRSVADLERAARVLFGERSGSRHDYFPAPVPYRDVTLPCVMMTAHPPNADIPHPLRCRCIRLAPLPPFRASPVCLFTPSMSALVTLISRHVGLGIICFVAYFDPYFPGLVSFVSSRPINHSSLLHPGEIGASICKLAQILGTNSSLSSWQELLP